ncbi:MAG: hypothetical protein R3C20_09250 [Planctomycetaceae bacterium]
MRTSVAILCLGIALGFLSLSDRLAAENNPQSGATEVARLEENRKQLVDKLGARHPAVTALDKKTAALRPNVVEMNDNDLRRTVQQLLVRVEQLE